MEADHNVPIPVRGYAQHLNSPHMDEVSKSNYYSMLVATRDFCNRIISQYDESRRKSRYNTVQHPNRKAPK